MTISEFLKNHSEILPIPILIFSLCIFTFLWASNYTIDEQAYFYTLSTISQTLAALIGIVGIFVIFRLQILKSKQIDDINRLRPIILAETFKEEYTLTFDSSGVGHVLLTNAKDLYHKQPPGPTSSPDLNEYISIVVGSIEDDSKYESYKTSIFVSMVMATIAISLSIIFLPFGNINIPDQRIFLSGLAIGSPLYAVGIVVSLTLAALCALVQSFYKLVMSEFD